MYVRPKWFLFNIFFKRLVQSQDSHKIKDKFDFESNLPGIKRVIALFSFTFSKAVDSV